MYRSQRHRGLWSRSFHTFILDMQLYTAIYSKSLYAHWDSISQFCGQLIIEIYTGYLPVLAQIMRCHTLSLPELLNFPEVNFSQQACNVNLWFTLNLKVTFDYFRLCIFIRRYPDHNEDMTWHNVKMSTIWTVRRRLRVLIHNNTYHL